MTPEQRDPREADEWRVEVKLETDEHGSSLGERLRSLDLDDEARKRLGGSVTVTRDGTTMFLYAWHEPSAREAERVVRELMEEDGLSDFGGRSVRRIKRATREMEVLVEALLLLAREADGATENQVFVANDVLRRELESARELLVGRPVELLLDEPARFSLEGSTQAFSVLCWQLIRNACQQTEQGNVLVSVLPGMISVRNHADPHGSGDNSHALRVPGADRHGFELAIAQRISDRFGWPLELQTRQGQENIARIRFPCPLPAAVPAGSAL